MTPINDAIICSVRSALRLNYPYIQHAKFSIFPHCKQKKNGPFFKCLVHNTHLTNPCDPQRLILTLLILEINLYFHPICLNSIASAVCPTEGQTDI